MKIWFISDTHNRHAELEVPNCDLVIHCGDEASVRKPWLNQIQSQAFFNWFEGLDIETKVFVPGNHSTAVAEGMVKPADYPSIKFSCMRRLSGTECESLDRRTHRCSLTGLT